MIKAISNTNFYSENSGKCYCSGISTGFGQNNDKFEYKNKKEESFWQKYWGGSLLAGVTILAVIAFVKNKIGDKKILNKSAENNNQPFQCLNDIKIFMTKTLGIKKVELEDNQENAKIIALKLQKMKEKGYQMPEKLYLVPYKDEAKMAKVLTELGKDPLKTESFAPYYGTTYKKLKTILFASDKIVNEHIVAHEIGHLIHDTSLINEIKRKDDDAIASLTQKEITEQIKNLTDIIKSNPEIPLTRGVLYNLVKGMQEKITKDVSEKAVKDEQEFVAEVFAFTESKEKKFDETIMNLYKLCGGHPIL